MVGLRSNREHRARRTAHGLLRHGAQDEVLETRPTVSGHRDQIDLLISKKKWNKLSKGQQAMIRMACMAGITNSIAEGESSQGPVIKANKLERGVNNMYWSQEMLDIFKEKWLEVAVELKQKDAFFAKAYDDLMQFREEYAFWQSKGFLPRGCK